MKKIRLFTCLLLATLVLVTGCSSKEEDLLLTSASQESESSVSAETEESADDSSIYVYICGAVKHPGVYRMKKGGRVYQLLRKAGGFSKKASGKSVNLAETVSDGQMVVIPEKEEAKGTGGDSASPGESTGVQAGTENNNGNKVNINTASPEDLISLSGIGEAKAQAIITYREENGSFQKTEDIMNVSGIGEATYANIKDSITV